MDDFLYYLAKQKYELYQWLYVRNVYAQQEQEIINRLENIHYYHMLLEVINMLPPENKLVLDNIEREHFTEAPYVTK